MLKNLDRRDPGVVDLTDKVLVHTVIPPENHAALRSGFAGYPANPRWNASKFRAWKMGCQFREALKQGQMAVRKTDCMLVPVAYLDEEKEDKPPSRSATRNLPGRMEGFDRLNSEEFPDFRSILGLAVSL